MLSYAIDNPAPSTVFLITGDRDFAYALSVLKNRHYRVVLVQRPDSHVSLTFQACVRFDWYDDVVHQAENPTLKGQKKAQPLSVFEDGSQVNQTTNELPLQDQEVTSSPIQRHRRGPSLSTDNCSPTGCTGRSNQDRAPSTHSYFRRGTF